MIPFCYDGPKKLIQYLILPSFSLPPTFSAEIYSISYNLDTYPYILNFDPLVVVKSESVSHSVVSSSL